MIDKSDNITNLSSALLKAQHEIGTALKNAKNPYFKSHYADMKAVIDAVKEPLNKNGIVFLQAVNGVGGDEKTLPVVETMLLHESGQYLCSRAPVFCQKPNDPQAFGTGITYTKRYALQAFLGLPTEDDDGNAASGKDEKGLKAKPKPINKSLEIVEEALVKFKEAHWAYLDDNPNVKLSLEKFKAAIIKISPTKALPTKKTSIPKIVEKVKLSDVIDDEFDAKVAEGEDGNV